MLNRCGYGINTVIKCAFQVLLVKAEVKDISREREREREREIKRERGRKRENTSKLGPLY
jgi:hypothetical protein